MAGRVQWEAQVDSNIKQLLGDAKQLRDELDGIKKRKYEVKLNIDEKKLENVISNLDKMLTSLGKGTGDFKEFENLSKLLNDIVSEVQTLNKAFNNTNATDALGNLLKDEESLKSITLLFQKIIEESNKIKNNELFNSEQLQELLSVFDKIENSLSSLRSIISDVGDGEEFSPLLKALNDIKEAASNIKLNFNMDLGDEVSERLNQKISQASARQLEAYRKLFSAMKGTKKTNKEMLKFFEPDEASVSELIGMYKGIIERAEKQFKVGNSNVYKKYLGAEYDTLKREITNVNKQLSRADSKRSENGILGDLFGNTKDLSGVIEQLNKIIEKLDEISKSALDFKSTFKERFNVTASIEEIDKLTNRVKELEDELSKIKLNPVNVDKSNISSGNIKEGLKEVQEQAEQTAKSVQEVSETPLKNVIQDSKSTSQKFEENIQNIANTTDKASQSLEKYTNKWKILTQVGDVGDKTFSATFEKNKGQIESVRWKAKSDDDGNIIYDDDGNIAYEVSSTTISSYQKLERAIVDADNELRKLEDRKSEVLKNDSNASIVNLDFLISDQKEYIKLLEQTVTYISQSNEYMLDEQQIIEARNKAEREYVLNKKARQEESSAKANAKEELEIQKQISKETEQQAIAQRKKWENFSQEQESYISNKYESDAIERNRKTYQELTSAIQQYSEVSKRIASGNILEGDIELAEKLENKISELQKQPILSTKQVEESEQKLVKLFNQLDVIEKKVKKKQEESSAKATKAESQKLAKEKTISRKAEKQSIQSSVDKALKDQVNAWKEIQNIREKIAKSNNSDEINELNESKEIYQKQYISADKILKANSDLYDKEAQLLKIEQIRLETNTKIAKYKGDTQETTLSSAEESLNKFQNKLSSLELKPDVEHRFPKYTEYINELSNAIKKYSDHIALLRSKQNNGEIITDEDINQVQEYEENITKLFTQVKKFSGGEKGYENISATKVAAQINKLLEDNTRMSKEAKEQIKAYYAEVASGNPTRPLKEIYNDALKVVQLEKEAGRGGKSFLSAIKEKMWYGAAGQIANMFGFYDIINYARQGIDTVRELDTAFTEMRKVSDETVNSLKNYQATTFDTADAVGTTAKQIQDSTADWMGEILVPLYGNI